MLAEFYAFCALLCGLLFNHGLLLLLLLLNLLIETILIQRHILLWILMYILTFIRILACSFQKMLTYFIKVVFFKRLILLRIFFVLFWGRFLIMSNFYPIFWIWIRNLDWSLLWYFFICFFFLYTLFEIVISTIINYLIFQILSKFFVVNQSIYWAIFAWNLL
jgi:hypothetical protein